MKNQIYVHVHIFTIVSQLEGSEKRSDDVVLINLMSRNVFLSGPYRDSIRSHFVRGAFGPLNGTIFSNTLGRFRRADGDSTPKSFPCDRFRLESKD